MALLESVNITFSVEPVLLIESTDIFRACTSAVKIEASFGRVAGHEGFAYGYFSTKKTSYSDYTSLSKI